jgi:hypothetical protein
MTKDREIIEDTLTLFKGRCGHQWIGSRMGTYACPLCGDYDGDHHLIGLDPIAVQPDDWTWLRFTRWPTTIRRPLDLYALPHNGRQVTGCRGISRQGRKTLAFMTGSCLPVSRPGAAPSRPERPESDSQCPNSPA